MHQRYNISPWAHFYHLQMKLDEGYVFTGICLFTGRRRIGHESWDKSHARVPPPDKESGFLLPLDIGPGYPLVPIHGTWDLFTWGPTPYPSWYWHLVTATKTQVGSTHPTGMLSCPTWYQQYVYMYMEVLPYSPEDYPILGRITLLPRSITLLPGRITLLPRRITLFSRRITLLPRSITLLPRRITLLPRRITLLPRRITVLLGSIALLPGSITLLPGRITLLPGRITLFPGRITLPPKWLSDNWQLNAVL